jgi:hypothetical protein
LTKPGRSGLYIQNPATNFSKSRSSGFRLRPGSTGVREAANNLIAPILILMHRIFFAFAGMPCRLWQGCEARQPAEAHPGLN